MNAHERGPAQSTARLYLQDDHCFEAEANVVAVRDACIAFDRTCFYPGGGGQPPDQGWVQIGGGDRLGIVSVHADATDTIWHSIATAPPDQILGLPATLVLDQARRLAHARYHTVLHVLNTIARTTGLHFEGRLRRSIDEVYQDLHDGEASLVPFSISLAQRSPAIARGPHRPPRI